MNLKEMFNDDSIEKQLNIVIGDTTYTNSELESEDMELTERLCSKDTLRFGSCEASTFQIRILNTVMPLKGKKIDVSMVLTGNETKQYSLGRYKVDSDKPTADRLYRDIVAYDAMYDITSADVADWYNKLLPNKDSTVTLKQFRDSFFSYFGIEQEEVELPNDGMTVERTIDTDKLSGQTVITCICEINGCFGHIGRNGKFWYIFLKEMVPGLYPSDTLYPRDDLYPAEPMNAEYISGSHYISAKYEDFTTARINKLQIRQEEDDIGCIYGDGDNCYIVQDNFLVYGKSTEKLQAIAANMYSAICKVWYRPAHVEAKGNPCLEVGAGIRLRTRYEIIYTYILQRTLKGIQALRDTYDAEGEQYQREEVNSVRESIIQLKGKTNKLTRTIEETRSEIEDIEKGLASRITQTAEAIETEVIRATAVEENLSSKISQTAESISTEVTRAQNAENALSSRIVQTAETISAEVERATAEEERLSASLELTAESISTEVARAQGAENSLSSRIAQTAEAIELKVSKGEVSSQLSVESGQVTIKSNRFALEATNCSISKEGNIIAKNVDLSGKITTNSGEIGGFTISSKMLYNEKGALYSSASGVYIGTDGIAVGPGSTAVGSAAFAVTRDGEIYLGYNSKIQSKGDIIFENTCVIKYGTTGTNHIRFSPDGIVVGGYGGKLGFFSSTNAGSVKKTISNLTATSPDNATLKNKINELLTALKAYNLIG